MSPEPKIQVVILNRNDFGLSRECLDCLLASTHKKLDILVIDSASTDGSAALLRAAFPGINVFESGKNPGYAAGCNLGIELSRAQNPAYFLFLNNDAQVEPEALSLLVRAGEENPATGIFGPLILSGKPESRIESGGMKCQPRTGRFRHIHSGKSPAGLAAGPLRPPAVPVDALSGCALLVRRETVEKIGGFAEEYFFYFEDADFCFRARRAGLSSLLVPPARVHHLGASTINRINPGLRVYYSTRNQLLFFHRQAPLRSFLFRSARDFFIILLNLGFALFRSGLPRSQAVNMWARGIRDFQRGRRGPAPEQNV